MKPTSLILRCFAAASVALSLSACGGSDDNDINVVPTGVTLADVAFADNDGYTPLDKLKPNGTVFALNDAGYGTRNPAYSAGNNTVSAWGIDTSATAPAEYTIEYGLTISAITADSAAVQAMKANLKIDTATGLITQACSGFPNCYDNASGTDQDFLMTVTAKVVGAKQALTRTFLLRIKAN